MNILNYDKTEPNFGSFSLFSSFHTAERMEAVQVHVCVNGLCAFCGSAPLVGVQQWAKVPCNNGGVKGNQIMLQKPEKSLDFCEVKVMGTSESTLFIRS